MSQPRTYPPEALDLFAAYRERRASYRPLECHQGSPCWVEDGPPSMTNAGRGNRCTGCGAPPRPIGRLHGRKCPAPYAFGVDICVIATGVEQTNAARKN